MADAPPTAAVTVHPAATILMIRDGADGLEVFMVKRHHQIDFAAGALVFPGGKLAKGDADPALGARLLGGRDLDDLARAVRVAAIREAFEEAGLFFARARGEARLLEARRLAALHPYRERLDRGGEPIAPILEAEDLDLDLDALVPFAHWITPLNMPKRFDTHFFVAAAPPDQVGVHDGSESVDSIWIRPRDALDAAAAGRMTVIFPTRMNLQLLAERDNVADALAAARARRVVTVLPAIEQRDGKPHLVLPPDAGYGLVAEPLDTALR